MPPLLIGRLLAMPGTPLPEDAQDRGILFIKKQTVIDHCAPDAGVDSGVPPDAATDAGAPDAGMMADAGVPPDADVDAGTCAGIEFVTTVTMIVQPELGLVYDDSNFALLYVTPARPQVSTQPGDIFGDLARATAPMIETEIVYIEDPALGRQCGGGCGGGGNYQQQESGCGGGYESSSWDPPTIADAGTGDGGLGIETVGPYEIVRAQPTSRAELVTWLDQLGYEYKPLDLDAVEPYIALGYHVVAVRMTASRAIGRRMTPLAFEWVGDEIRVPAALGRAPDPFFSQVPLTVYVAGDQRYDLPNATVPFAMHTSYGNWQTGYLTRNDIVLDTNQPVSADPIASGNGRWDYRETKVVTEEKRVPQTVYCDDNELGLCSDCSSGTRRRQIDFGTIALAALSVLRRRRGRRSATCAARSACPS